MTGAAPCWPCEVTACRSADSRVSSVPIRLSPMSESLSAFLNRRRDTAPEPKDVLRRVHVAVVARATRRTHPGSYSKPCDTFRPLRRQRTARRAGLGRELLVDVQVHSAVPAGFVAELRPEHRPAGVEHGLCHPRLRQPR